MASRGSISGISSAGTTQKVELQSSGSKTIKMNELKSQLSSDSSVQPSTSNADPNPAASAADFKEKKIGHRRVDETTGQVTYKKKATSDLMRAIQLGIGQSVGSLTSKPTRDVLMQDFSVVESVHFPENGSNLTPAHRVGEFRFKTYAPVAFRYFRELFGIRTDDFLVSLCSLPMTELSNPGASGSVFFITEDDEFIIKTVQHKEADFLQKLLPGYYMNLNQNPRTLLPKFYGLYCYQSGGKNIRIVVMNNLLPKAIRASEKYDLKGSTYKRKASKHELAKSSPTFKDLDFKDKNKDGIFLEADTFEALMKTMKRDCRVLESFKIMDYSLLLAVHNLDDKKRKLPDDGYDKTQIEEGLPAPSTSHGVQGAEAGIAVPGSINRGRSTKYRLQQFSTAMESIQADVDVVDPEDENIPHGGIPARNHKGEQLVLFMGIIDILQSYRLKKKLEHGFKSIVHDGDTISVVRPSFYSQRFLTFFEKEVFRKVPSPMRSPSKKKLYGRTRAEDNKDIGVGLVRSKPDVIAQVTESENSNPSTSSHLFPVRYSQNTINTSFTSSSTTNTTGASYRAESNLSMVRESTSSTYDDHLPPVHADDPLPPYSEFHEFHPAQQHQFTGNFEPQKRSMQSAEADPQPLRLPLSVSSPIPASGAHRVDETVSAPSVTKKAGIDPSEATTSIAQDFEKGIRFSKKEENDESLAVANGQKLVNKGDDANDVPAADPAGVVLEIGDGSVALPSENEETYL